MRRSTIQGFNRGGRLAALLATTALVAGTMAPARAAPDIWQGGGASNNWSDGPNWTTGSPPANGDDVILQQNGPEAPSNFDINLTANSLTLNNTSVPFTFDNGYQINNGGGFVLGLQSGGFVIDNAANLASDQINTGITLNGPATITLSAGATGLAFGVNPIIGTGPLTLVNNSTDDALRLNVANSYTGATTINGTGRVFAAVNGAIPTGSALTVNGSVLFGASSTIGSLAGGGNVFMNGSNTLTVGGDNTATTFSGVYQDSGGAAALVKVGSGTLTLLGINTYTGATTVAGGALVVGGSIASSSITVNGDLDFINSSTAGSATITNNGGLQFLDASTAGSASIANNIGAFVSFSSTAGSASIINNGTLQFFGTGTAGSAAITNNGIVFFDNTSTAGSAAITTNSGGRIIVLHSGGGGTARFILNGTGFLDISELFLAGTTAGSIEGAGNVFLGAKNLAVGGNNLSTTFSGVIQDSGAFGGTGGSLTKTGAGTLNLSGVNTYTGPTTVDGGILSVNGSIASSSLTTVNAGGMLGGNGTVGNTVINGGTLAPGNSIGLLTVQGSLAFTAASSYMVEVSPANADRVNVTGGATLGGATVNASFAAGTYVAKQYTILNATGGVGGTFNSLVNTDLPANFSSSLSYDANDAFLNLTLNFAVPTGLNVNQQNVANALTNFFNTTGGIPLVFGALTPAGLTQASGEVATGSQQTTFDAMGMFMGLLTDPFIVGRGDDATHGVGATPFAEEGDNANAYAANGKARSKSKRDAYAAIYHKAPPIADTFAQRWSVWAAGFGGSQTTDGNAALGSNTATSRIYGTAVGADYRFSPFTLAGFALAGGGTNFSIANALGTGRSDLFQAGAFVRHVVGPAYISGALAYGWQDVTTDRTVTIAGVDRLRAEFNANAFSGRVEGGYRFVTPWTGGLGITPYAAGQFTTFDLPAYAEQALSGANTFALAYGSKSVTDTRSELGIRTDKSFAVPDAILTLRGRLAWAHDFNPDRSIAATFQTLPSASFVVNGATQASDSALTTASAEVKWMNGWSAAATFEGEFSDVTRSYAGKGVVRYIW